MPRIDAASVFGRILDAEHGGYCSIGPVDPDPVISRRYLDDSLVMETTFRSAGGEARLIDCFTVREGGRDTPHRQLLRIVEGVRGRVELRVEVVPRLDYGEVRPWLRQHGEGVWSATGGSDALVIAADYSLAVDGHDFASHIEVRAGSRARLSITFVDPASLDGGEPEAPEAGTLDQRLEDTLDWWRRWSSRIHLESPDCPAARRSAIVLKGLVHAPTGAIAAAPTTSLPEAPGGSRNWDYRLSWVRDSAFAVRALAELGGAAEADGFRRFIERCTAGSVETLQIVYGVRGQRRLPELSLDHLEGYRGSRPVRIGNGAARQVQNDVYGELVDLTWRWHQRGHSPDDDYWRFLLQVIDAAATRWSTPDRGLWEMRGQPRHFVHSKVMCWVALDRGIRLAKECLRQAPLRRWTTVRNQIRASIEAEGLDTVRGCFVQAYGGNELDAALLLLPTVGFIAYDDERMLRTTDAIRTELDDGSGLLLRYRSSDALEGQEGAFVACSFWLAECLAHQGRPEEARSVFDRASSAGNDLGLFAEEYSASTGLLGNFPQGLSHLAHIAAAVAMANHDGARTAETAPS